MTTLIIIGILFVFGMCAIFLLFPPKSQHQIQLEDEEEAQYWADYANAMKKNAQRESVKRKFPKDTIVHDYVSREDRLK